MKKSEKSDFFILHVRDLMTQSAYVQKFFKYPLDKNKNLWYNNNTEREKDKHNEKFLENLLKRG